MKVVIILALFFAGCSGLENGNIIKQIVSGSEVGDCELPHIAFLLLDMPDGSRTTCGGSLIDDNHVLTAAHCLYDATDVTVFLGHSDKNKAPQYIRGILLKTHPRFRKGRRTLVNDVGVIKLRKPAKLGRCVKTISLPTKDQAFTGTCIIAGWGRINNNIGSQDRMRKADIKVIPAKECKKYAPEISSDQHICAGDRSVMGKNICRGDSGGPLMCRSGNKYVVAGVASYVFNCEKGFGVYANVSSHLDWIKKVMKY